MQGHHLTAHGQRGHLQLVPAPAPINTVPAIAVRRGHLYLVPTAVRPSC